MTSPSAHADDADEYYRKPTEHRGLGIALALVAIAALAFAHWSQAWLESPDHATGFGLRTLHVCAVSGDVHETCAEQAILDFAEARADFLDEREHVSPAFPYLGWATSVLIAIAATGLGLAALIALLRKRPAAPIAPPTIALVPGMLSMITGCVFVATKPGGTGFVGVGYGFWVFGGGMICAILAALLLARSLRPHDPDLTAGAIDPDDF